MQQVLLNGSLMDSLVRTAKGKVSAHRTRMRAGVKNSRAAGVQLVGKEELLVWPGTDSRHIREHGSKVHVPVNSYNMSLVNTLGQLWNGGPLPTPTAGRSAAVEPKRDVFVGVMFDGHWADHEVFGKDPLRTGRELNSTRNQGTGQRLNREPGLAGLAICGSSVQWTPVRTVQEGKAPQKGGARLLMPIGPLEEKAQGADDGKRRRQMSKWAQKQLMPEQLNDWKAKVRTQEQRERFKRDRDRCPVRKLNCGSGAPLSSSTFSASSPSPESSSFSQASRSGFAAQLHCSSMNAGPLPCSSSETCSTLPLSCPPPENPGPPKHDAGKEQARMESALQALRDACTASVSDPDEKRLETLKLRRARGLLKALAVHARAEKTGWRPWEYASSRDPPGLALQDLQRLGAHVEVLRSECKEPHFPLGAGRWVMSCDTGLNTYLTIINVNTGDLYRIGHGSWRQVRFHLERADVCVSDMAKLANKQKQVQDARKKMETDAGNQPARARADYLRELQKEKKRLSSASTSTHHSGNGSASDSEKYVDLTRQALQQRAKARAIVDRLIKSGSQFLSAVGRQGVVCFPTNLCDQSMMQAKKIDSNAKRGIAFMAFGRLLRDLEQRCTQTGAFVWKVREDRTSKWCTGCGVYCGYLGAGNTFRCPNSKCLLQVGRDAGAARSIFVLAFMGRLQKQLPRTAHAVLSAGAVIAAEAEAARAAVLPPSGNLKSQVLARGSN